MIKKYKYYSNVGVVEVLDKIEGKYRLKGLNSGMVLIVSYKSPSLRDLISKSEINEVLRIVKDLDGKIEPTTWTRRYRNCLDKLQAGSASQVAEVLRDLVSLSRSQDLSFGERKMLQHAKNLLNAEIRFVTEFEDFDIEMEMCS